MKICRYFFSKVVPNKHKCENIEICLISSSSFPILNKSKLVPIDSDLTVAVCNLNVAACDISITKYKKIKQFYIYKFY